MNLLPFIILGDLSLHFFYRKYQSLYNNVMTNASSACATKASEAVADQAPYSLDKIRTIRRADLCISERCIGKGVFGKCYIGKLGHIDVCVKAFRKHFESALNVEAHLLSQCCHKNLPWLYGVVMEDRSLKVIVMSFHGNDGSAVSLHHILCSQSQSHSSATLLPRQAKTVVLGLVSALKYLHDKSIIHNDIKSDNVVVEYCSSVGAKAVLVDFGKACYTYLAKKYSLSKEGKQEYSKKHPQIAPDLRDGHCLQSFASDIYAFGRVVKSIDDIFLHIPVVASLSNTCMDYLCSNRPTTMEVFTFFSNLFPH